MQFWDGDRIGMNEYFILSINQAGIEKISQNSNLYDFHNLVLFVYDNVNVYSFCRFCHSQITNFHLGKLHIIALTSNFYLAKCKHGHTLISH